jgi:hypothetical protein
MGPKNFYTNFDDRIFFVKLLSVKILVVSIVTKIEFFIFLVYQKLRYLKENNIYLTWKWKYIKVHIKRAKLFHIGGNILLSSVYIWKSDPFIYEKVILWDVP